MTPLSPSPTLAEAQGWLRDQLQDGAKCPCCTQHAQVYRWSLYSTAVRALALFHRLGSTERYIHSSQLKEFGYKGQGDASRLRHWGLVVEEKQRRDDGGRSGFWRVTDNGRRYLTGQLLIPKYVHVYDGRVLYTSGPLVSVQDAVGKKFNLAEVMGGQR